MIYHVINNQIIELDPDLPSIEKFYRHYVPDQSLIVYPGVDINYLEIPSDISHIVFDCATNPVVVESLLKDINLSRPFSMISGLFNYHTIPPQDPRIKFFPFWCVWAGRQEYQFSNSPKKYKLSCLNGVAREHRKLTYLHLKSKKYFDQIIFTFGHRPESHENYDGWALTDQEQREFARLPQDVEFIPSDQNGIDVTIDHPAYLESFCNLVTETTISSNTPMLSEKTLKPIMAGQLFILIASPGAIQFLRGIGIDTFDDIIDHGYDNIINIRSRIESALTQVDLLIEQDLIKIYDSIKPRLIKNSEYLKSSEFHDQFVINFG